MPTVCRSAHDESPSECFLASSSTGLNESQRMQLCTEAISPEPSNCYKSIRAVIGSNIAPDQHLVHACHRASSSVAPCFVNAPKYIHWSERAELCRHTNSTDPILCVQSIESFSKQLITVSPQNIKIRSQLLGVCSRHDLPVLAISECIHASYTKGLALSEATELCIRLKGSIIDFTSVPQCLQLLNRDGGVWDFKDGAILCGGKRSNLFVQQVTSCAIKASSQSIGVSRARAVELCQVPIFSQTHLVNMLQDTSVIEYKLSCVKRALSKKSMGPAPDIELVLDICISIIDRLVEIKSQHEIISEKPFLLTGECLAQTSAKNINGTPRPHLAWDTGTIETLCRSAYRMRSAIFSI